MSSDQNAQPTVIIARHGEKPENHHHSGPHGVDHHGTPTEHGLVPRGWIRSGALAAFFAGPDAIARGLPRPERVYASRPTSKSPSHRALDTAVATATRLGLTVDDSFEDGHEKALVKNLLKLASPALVVWHHGTIPSLARHFPLAPGTDIPPHWDQDRFDLFWVMTPGADGYRLHVIAQDLLAGDAAFN